MRSFAKNGFWKIANPHGIDSYLIAAYCALLRSYCGSRKTMFFDLLNGPPLVLMAETLSVFLFIVLARQKIKLLTAKAFLLFRK